MCNLRQAIPHHMLQRPVHLDKTGRLLLCVTNRVPDARSGTPFKPGFRRQNSRQSMRSVQAGGKAEKQSVIQKSTGVDRGSLVHAQLQAFERSKITEDRS